VLDLRTGRYRTLAANLSTAWIRGISLVAGGSEIVADAFDGGPRVECRLGHDQRVLRRPPRIAFGNGARPRNDRDRRLAGRGVASFDLTGVRRLGQEVTTNARLTCAGNTYGPCDAVSPHTNLLADTRSDGTVEIVNLHTLHRVEISPDHNGPDDAVTCLPDGRTVVHGGFDGHVTLWM
jgi:WD40 repeat protein